MFHARDRFVDRASGRVVELGFTHADGGTGVLPGGSLNFGYATADASSAVDESFARLAAAFEVPSVAVMSQIHGADVVMVRSAPQPLPSSATPRCDALVTDVAEVALCARAADCAPVLLFDVAHGIVGAVHCGRPGLVAGVVPAALAAIRDLGADDITGVLGPHVCGGCYEVPADLRDEVAARVPISFATTTWGTPSVDIGAGVVQQLVAGGCAVVDRSACTMHTNGLHSYRRDGDRSGRMAAVVVWRELAA